MAEVVVGSFLSASLQVLFDRLASGEISSFFQGEEAIVDLLRELRIKVLSATKLLNDAEEKQIKDDLVRQWLDMFKDTIFQADDLSDKIDTEVLRRNVEGESSRVLENITTLISGFNLSVKKEATEIIHTLKNLLDEKDVIGLREASLTKIPSETIPVPLVEESDVFGRAGDKEAVVDLLLSNVGNSNNISVIPIVGMGGIGKTTLAQLVYSDERVQKHFELRAWVTVSDDFDVNKITKIILGKVIPGIDHVGDSFELRQKLKEALKGKRFLFVHDDVWNEKYHLWNSLKSSFESGAAGSKIVVTTRSEIVASVMAVGPTHHLTHLLSGDCWKLFVKHAFGVHTDLGGANEDLEAIGRKIVVKCKGLPLAIQSLGGTLRSERNPQKWEDILKSDVWDELCKKEGSILPALWLSYRHLPTHLKRCFAYFSMFPKDCEFEKDKIVLLWMAEGYLQTNKRAIRIEEVGEQYFDDLLSRSLLQRSSKDGSIILMHDLVHDLSMFVAGEFCVSVDHNDDMSKITNKTRHISYNAKKCDWSKSEDLCKAKCLRTFVGLPVTDVKLDYLVCHNFLLTKGSALRVLSLSRSFNTKLLESIGNLIHLRYLDLSRTEIEELPNSVCTLYNLQTLLLSWCHKLIALPKKMEKLINLRHLDIEGVPLKEMAMQIKNMKSLQTLNHIIVGDGDGNRGWKINELKEIQPFGGRLEITRIENVVNAAEALEANLKGKKGLKDLSLRWSSETANEASSSEREREILDSLEPHSNLEKLVIDGYRGTQFSDWVGRDSFSNIISVNLYNCKSCLSLPPLGQLPSLKQLYIVGFERVERIGEELFGNGPSFMCLEVLWVWYMPELREWSLGECRVFLGLSSLSLQRCPKLNMKVHGSCTAFPSLVKLDVSDCPGELDSLLVDNLEELRLEGNCEKLIQWNSNVHTLSSLKILTINKWEGESFPPQGSLLPSSLTTLHIWDCRNLVALNGMAFQQLTSLMDLIILQCPKLGCLPEEGLPASLRSLEIVGWEGESFPPQGWLLPSSLTTLHIGNCRNLVALNGKAFQQLTSLDYLTIFECRKLGCLPEEGLPASLETLRIYGSPLVKERCEKEKGEDWPKIAHIPNIKIERPLMLF